MYVPCRYSIVQLGCTPRGGKANVHLHGRVDSDRIQGQNRRKRFCLQLPFPFRIRGSSPDIIAGRLNASVGGSRPSSVRCLRAGDHGGSTAGQRGLKRVALFRDRLRLRSPARTTHSRSVRVPRHAILLIPSWRTPKIGAVDANRSPLFPSVPLPTQSGSRFRPPDDERRVDRAPYRSSFALSNTSIDRLPVRSGLLPAEPAWCHRDHPS